MTLRRNDLRIREFAASRVSQQRARERTIVRTVKELTASESMSKNDCGSAWIYPRPSGSDAPFTASVIIQNSCTTLFTCHDVHRRRPCPTLSGSASARERTTVRTIKELSTTGSRLPNDCGSAWTYPFFSLSRCLCVLLFLFFLCVFWCFYLHVSCFLYSIS